MNVDPIFSIFLMMGIYTQRHKPTEILLKHEVKENPDIFNNVHGP